MFAFYDPIRPQVPAAIKNIESHGVRMVLVTGDLAGTAVSLFFIWFYFFSSFFRPTKRNLKEFIFVTIFSIIFVAVLWEIYELFLGEAKFAKAEYPYDTTLDFVMDFLGALAGCLYAYIKEINRIIE